MIRLLFVAFAAKMAGALVRYAVTFEVYGGRADAGGYHGSGRRLAAAFWDGTWDRVLQQEVPELAGTEFIRLVTGAVYVVTGPTKLGGFLVFAWLGFWGLVCLFRAFRVAFPGGDHWRYGILLFFLPSLLYWPSSLGKESWMLFAIGVAVYGAALVLSHRSHGYVVLVLGFAATAAVRPHVTLLLFVALFVGVLLRRRSWRETRLGLLGRIAGLAVLVGIGTVVFAQTADFFNVDNLDQSSVEQVLDRASEQSAGGTSEFDAPRPDVAGRIPLRLPHCRVPAVAVGGQQHACARRRHRGLHPARAHGLLMAPAGPPSRLLPARAVRRLRRHLRRPVRAGLLVDRQLRPAHPPAHPGAASLPRPAWRFLPPGVHSSSPRNGRSRRQPRVSSTSRARSATVVER